MSAELDAFRAQLHAAGHPYSLWGGRIFGVGLAFLVAGQVMSAYALLLVAVAVVIMAIGWSLLVVAFVRRRRWSRAHPLVAPPLPPLPTPPLS